jgi:tripartite-type tricarboxylate transporter receptor subunit TctC
LRSSTVSTFGLLLGLSSSICMASNSSISAGAEYPTHPIRILVGFSPGSTTDILARSVGQKMKEAWGQPVLVDNRPSAGGIAAASTVAAAAPDGYTLLVVSTGHAATAAMFSKLPYDTLGDFAGVSRIVNVPSLLVVSPALGVKSVKELVALAKARPGRLNFSSPGVGSANHLAGELFTSLAGIQAVHVPYRGIPEAMAAVVSDSIQFSFQPVTNALPLTHDGKLLALATSTGKRLAGMPGLPTVAEAGVPGYRFDPWYGMLAPAKTPKALLDKLSGEVARIAELPDFREQMRALGAEPAPTTPEGFDSLVRSEVAKYGKIVRDAHIQAE